MVSEGEVFADLQPVGILSHIKPEHLEALKFYGVFGEFAANEILIKQGEEQKKLYFIVAGKVEVLLDYAGEQISLGFLEKGDCFGELSVFEPGPASASIKVIDTVVLWHLDAFALQDFFDQIPQAASMLMVGMCQILSHRLRLADDVITRKRVLQQNPSIRSEGGPAPIKADKLTQEVKSKGIFKKIFSK
ncbi:MAG: cyclic nucleotide-binding domain-containing protein [Verrucomicrobiota bacterium]